MLRTLPACFRSITTTASAKSVATMTPTPTPATSASGSTIKVLSSAQVAQVISHISLPELLLSQAKAFLAVSSTPPSSSSSSSPTPTFECPQRIALTTSPWFTQLFMPSRTKSASDGNADSVVKMVSVPKPAAPVEAARGGIQGTNIQISARTGKAEVLLNSTQLTPLRNAAGSLLSSILAFPTDKGPSNLVVFGDGQQSVFHVWMHIRYFRASITEITVVVGSHRTSLSQEEVESKHRAFLSSLKHLFEHCTPSFDNQGVTDRVNDILDRLCVIHPTLHATELANKLLGRADLVITCTPSTVPLFAFSSLPTDKRVHVVAIGSYKPSMCELPPELVTLVSKHRGALMVDSIPACEEEAGCLLQTDSVPGEWTELGTLLPAVPNSNSDTEDAQAEAATSWLRSLETKDTNRNPETAGNNITIFKSVGIGLQDTEITKLVTRYAQKLDIGTHVPF